MASIVNLSISLFAVLLLVPQLFGSFVAYQIGLFLIYGIVAQGIGYLWGRTGILPLGQAAFFGVSAYACAHILTSINGLGWQVASLIVVVIVITIIAFGFATIVFKSRSDSGPYFSLITLALAMIAEQISGTAVGITGGFNGISGFTPIGDLDQFGSLYYVIAIFAVLSTALLVSLDRMPAGLVARAVADNEPRLQLFGFPTYLVKGLIFALSAALAAIAGILFANHQGIVTPTSTGFLLSANLVIWTAVGGRFHVLGPLIGAVGIGYMSSVLRDSFAYWEAAVALLFIAVVMKAPGGVAEFLESFMRCTLRWKPSTKRTTILPPEPRNIGNSSAFHFENLAVKVGSVHILNGVDLTTPDTGIVCIIGPNGAGKTSMLNVITGELSLSAGKVALGDDFVHNRPPHKALKSGIARKLQIPSVFSSMTVGENLTLAMLAARGGFLDFFKPNTLLWRSQRLANLLETPLLPLKPEMATFVSDLSQGHKQFLEFAMTTASESRVLLLDEPCAGLSPEETTLMTSIVKTFHERNKGLILLIEHDMSIVKALADRVVVLHQGAVLAEGSYDEIRVNKNVQAVYSGGVK